MQIAKIRLEPRYFERPKIIMPGQVPQTPELRLIAYPDTTGEDGKLRAYQFTVLIPGKEFTGGVIMEIESAINKLLAYKEEPKEETDAQDS